MTNEPPTSRTWQRRTSMGRECGRGWLRRSDCSDSSGPQTGPSLQPSPLCRHTTSGVGPHCSVSAQVTSLRSRRWPHPRGSVTPGTCVTPWRLSDLEATHDGRCSSERCPFAVRMASSPHPSAVESGGRATPSPTPPGPRIADGGRRCAWLGACSGSRCSSCSPGCRRGARGERAAASSSRSWSTASRLRCSYHDWRIGSRSPKPSGHAMARRTSARSPRAGQRWARGLDDRRPTFSNDRECFSKSLQRSDETPDNVIDRPTTPPSRSGRCEEQDG
jgi:hypothetical protein